jgi:hypothetical protein
MKAFNGSLKTVQGSGLILLFDGEVGLRQSATGDKPVRLKVALTSTAKPVS